MPWRITILVGCGSGVGSEPASGRYRRRVGVATANDGAGVMEAARAASVLAGPPVLAPEIKNPIVTHKSTSAHSGAATAQTVSTRRFGGMAKKRLRADANHRAILAPKPSGASGSGG